MPLLMRKYELEKKGHKIRAWVKPPPHFRAMPELKRLFPGDAFPKEIQAKIDDLESKSKIFA